MAFILFADGVLVENPQGFSYSVDTGKFKNTHNLEKIKEQPSGKGLLLQKIGESNGKITLTYLKNSQKMRLLNTFRNTMKKPNQELLKKISEQIILLTKKEYENGFFVLPIPENFLVTKDGQVSFIYKALPSMPITNFGFDQIEKNLKRILLFIFLGGHFDDFLKSEKIETKEPILISITQANTFQELYYAILEKELIDLPNQEELAAPKKQQLEPKDAIENKRKILDEISKSDSAIEKIPPNIQPPKQPIPTQDIAKTKTLDNREKPTYQEITESTPPIEKLTSVVGEKKQTEKERPIEAKKKAKPHKGRDQKKSKNHSFIPFKASENIKVEPLKSSTNRAKIGVLLLSIFLLISLVGNGALLIDKVTYPSRIGILKKDNKELQDSLESEKEKKQDAEKELEVNKEQSSQLKTENDEQKKEIEENVKTIKTILEKNKELQEALKK